MRNHDLLKAAWKRANTKAYAKNKEKKLALARKWALDHPDKMKEIYKRYYLKNKKARLALVKEREFRKIQRIPKWADLKAIKQVYDTCPPGYHVDHIVPLRGKNVSGLHVHYNLQHIKAEDNLRKGNRWQAKDPSPS